MAIRAQAPLFEEKVSLRLVDLVLQYTRKLTKKAPQKGRFRDFYLEESASFSNQRAAIVQVQGMIEGRVIISAPKEMLVHFAGFVLGAENVNEHAANAILADIANTITCNGSTVVGNDYQFSAPEVILNYNAVAEHKLKFPLQAAPFHWFGYKGYIIFEKAQPLA